MATMDRVAGARLGALVLTLCLSFSAHQALADQVIADDLIVDGNNCVGQDCVNGEVFSDQEMTLKENNLRIRWFSSNAPDVLAKSWEMEGNASANGAGSYFSMEAKSLMPDDGFLVSDGFAEGPDCAVGDSYDLWQPSGDYCLPIWCTGGQA